MLQIPTERRVCERRASRCGGRRVTDQPGRPCDLPTCLVCHWQGVAALASESDGGWWFACPACNEVWDQRQAGREPYEVTTEADHRAVHDACVSYRRLAVRRAS